MAEKIYTVAVWRVKPGMKDQFEATWHELSLAHSKLPNPPQGKNLLLQSTSDSHLYYSFGTWKSMEDVQKLRTNQKAVAVRDKLSELVIEGTPGNFQLVGEFPAKIQRATAGARRAAAQRTATGARTAATRSAAARTAGRPAPRAATRAALAGSAANTARPATRTAARPAARAAARPTTAKPASSATRRPSTTAPRRGATAAPRGR